MAASLLLAVPPLLQISQDLATLQSDCHPQAQQAPGRPKRYRPIALLCVPYKFLERLLHTRLDPVIDPQLPCEQTGFRRGRSTADQVTLLTQDIEDAFDAGEKAGVVLLDLSAAYDTVWLRGLHLKLLQMIPDRHIHLYLHLQIMGISKATC